MRIFAATALALMASATPALAQDATFQGPRIEAVGGWDNIKSDGISASGFVYGGAAGYDLQRGNLVVGVDGEITGTTTKKTFDLGTIKGGRDLYAGVRIGYVVAPATLLYGKVGYDNSRVIARSGQLRDAENLDGVRLGAGVERSFGHYYGKVEYRYTNASQDVIRHQVLAGIGYRF
ncbi:porin family protein [Sphingomonas sp. ABOLD]|uniref:Outer membrane immunogenic protein n=1 Tax=Sphingomonas trueperi TaxID=53317 RepID=A0A7X6BBV0_9SPHN|nr:MULTISPECIES: porin family protein [Sphingomonas]NJB96585.1 outer membrane immunogenic protein [Sphingomonas trueperi]RSV46674.1 porin family protein [Sphingomonas sp. ABOLD]